MKKKEKIKFQPSVVKSVYRPAENWIKEPEEIYICSKCKKYFKHNEIYKFKLSAIETKHICIKCANKQ